MGMESNKQTAVELIEEKIKFNIKLAKMDNSNNVQWSMSVIISMLERLYFDNCEQAKEMEKQQLESCYNHGSFSILENGHGDTFNEYYTKTFKQ